MTFPPEWFYHACDKSYQLATEHLPQAVRDRPEATASVLGFGAAYTTVYLLEKGIERVLGPERASRWLPALENIGLASAAVVPFLTAVVDPHGMRDMLQNHPVYTSGCVGLITGSVTRAVQDLGALQPLEDKLNSFWKRFKQE